MQPLPARRPRVLRLGYRFVVDLHLRADDQRQARAPAVPGDDLLATRQESPRPPGQPGGLFPFPAPSIRPATDRPTTETRSPLHRFHRTQPANQQTPKPSTDITPDRESEQGEAAMFAFETTATIERERWRVAGALRRRLVRARRPVLLGAARRHPARQGVLPRSARCGSRASTRPSSGASRGACGVASSSPTARCWPRSVGAGVRPRCAPPEPVLEDLVPVFPVEKTA